MTYTEIKTYRLHDIKQLVKAYSGNDNPGIFVLTDTHDNFREAISPSCIFIDDDGDVIIQVDKNLL